EQFSGKGGGLPGNRNIALERVEHRAALAPGDGAGNAMAGADAAWRQRHKRGASAIGGLHGAGRAHAMTEEGSVGIANHGEDGRSGGQGGCALCRVAKARIGEFDLSEHGLRHAEEGTELSVPAE